MQYHPRFKGQSLIEIVIAIGLLVLLIVTVGVIAIDAGVSERRTSEYLRAALFAQEGLEAARSIRDADFFRLTNGTYGLALQGGVWTVSGASDASNGFTRTIQIASVDTDIVAVTSTVSWDFTPSVRQQISFVSLLTNWRKIVNPGTWTTPEVASTTTIPGNVTARAVAVNGQYLYVTSPQNSNGGEFFVFDVTDPTAPLLVGQAELATTCNMLDVYGNKAYVGSNANLDEVKIIDVLNPSNPQEIGSVALTGSADVFSVAASGTQSHSVRDVQGNQATYWIHDVSNPASPTTLGSLNLGSGAYDLVLRQGPSSYAFVAAIDDDQELKIVNVTNVSNPAVVGGYNISGPEDGLAIAVSGTKAFLGTKTHGTGPEFYIIDATNISSPTVLGTHEIGGNVNRMRRVGSAMYLATSSSTAEYIVMDVSNPAEPIIIGKQNLSGNATGLALSEDGQVAYVATDDPAAGLVILQTTQP